MNLWQKAAAALCVTAGAAGVGWGVHAEIRAERLARALQEAEAEVLRQRGGIVAARASDRELEEAAAPLREQIEELAGDDVGISVTETLTWETEAFRVPWPRDVAAPTRGGGATEGRPDNSSSSPPAPAGPSDFSHCPEPLLKVETTEARLETEKGNAFAVGEVEVWRLAPPPQEVIWREPFRANASALLRRSLPADDRGPSWGLGGGLIGRSVALAGLWEGRERRVLGVEVRPWVVGAVGWDPLGPDPMPDNVAVLAGARF
jgi:hypothetical protein